MSELLSDEQIEQRMTTVPQWERDGDSIVRTYEAPDFLAGIAKVHAAAEIAERSNHHPDIDIRWRTVMFRLTTHDAGGLTAKDFALAKGIESLL